MADKSSSPSTRTTTPAKNPSFTHGVMIGCSRGNRHQQQTEQKALGHRVALYLRSEDSGRVRPCTQVPACTHLDIFRPINEADCCRPCEHDGLLFDRYRNHLDAVSCGQRLLLVCALSLR